MKIFGLTGGVGSGKSSVAKMLRKRGIPVVDADALARRLTEKGSPVLDELTDAFGPRIRNESGELVRSALAALVFENDEARARLNAILHPKIGALARDEFSALAAAGHPIAGYEVPLLFETNQEEAFRPVIVVATAEENQVRRAMARSGWSENEARARVAAQMPLAEKARRADYVVENNGDEADLDAATAKLVEFLERSGRR